jgi:hypothetical protein
MNKIILWQDMKNTKKSIFCSDKTTCRSPKKQELSFFLDVTWGLTRDTEAQPLGQFHDSTRNVSRSLDLSVR